MNLIVMLLSSPKMVSGNKEGEVYTRKYTYRYDNQGNWIEKHIEYSKRYTNLIVERTIEYANE